MPEHDDATPKYPFPVHVLDWKSGKLVYQGDGDPENVYIVIVDGECISELEPASPEEAYFLPPDVARLRDELVDAARRGDAHYEEGTIVLHYYAWCQRRISSDVEHYINAMSQSPVYPQLDWTVEHLRQSIRLWMDARALALTKIQAMLRELDATRSAHTEERVSKINERISLMDAHRRYPKMGIFADISVMMVITDTIRRGEAHIEIDPDGGVLYVDPMFGPPVPLESLRCDAEIGLHSTAWNK